MEHKRVDPISSTPDSDSEKYDHGILMLGETGSGKTTILSNLLPTCGFEGIDSRRNATTETRRYKGQAFDGKSGEWIGVDTPGLYDTAGTQQDIRHVQEILEILQALPDGLSLVLIPIPITETRLDGKFFAMLEMYETLFGVEIIRRVRFIFTMIDNLIETKRAEFKTQWETEFPQLILEQKPNLVDSVKRGNLLWFNADKPEDCLRSIVEEAKPCGLFKPEILSKLGDLEKINFESPAGVLTYIAKMNVEREKTETALRREIARLQAKLQSPKPN